MWRSVFLFCILLFTAYLTQAQCSVCTKTAEQLGEGPASALNNAIVYLMMTPLLIMGFVGFRWWKREKAVIKAQENS